jgi:hypothetical protein
VKVAEGAHDAAVDVGLTLVDKVEFEVLVGTPETFDEMDAVEETDAVEGTETIMDEA